MKIILAIDAILFLAVLLWAGIYRSFTGKEPSQRAFHLIGFTLAGGVIAFFVTALVLYG